MSAKAKKPSKLTNALLDTAKRMRKTGLMPEAAYQKITMRHLTHDAPAHSDITPDEIRAMRERAHMSQAVFAHRLNVTVGYISRLERGAKRPTGAALALLGVIQRKGIDAIL